MLDPESQLQYFGARYLSNELTRLTSVDPARESFNRLNPQSWNRYAYALNDPVNKVDPDGRFAIAIPIAYTLFDLAATVVVTYLGLDFVSDGEIDTFKPPTTHLEENKKPVTITIDREKHPEAAGHAEEAIGKGVKAEGIVDREGAAKRRKEKLAGTPTVKDRDRDEFPPAVINTGSKESSIKHIKPGDNRGAGSSLGKQLKGVPNGSKVKIEIKN